MHLKTLTYTSRASLDLTEGDLAEILASAQRTNARQGITGLLIFNGVRFLQIVEGEEGAIDGLVTRLRADRRHTGFELHDERSVETRSFPGWSMELVHVDSELLGACDQVEDKLPASVPAAIRRLVLRHTEAIGRTVRLPD